MTIEEDFYATLELTEEATPKDIKKAYKALALKWHPDKNPGNKEAEAKFLKIVKAYETLTDESKKSTYDSSLHAKKAKKRKESEMSADRKKMKEDLERKEKEHSIKKEERRAAKAQKQSEDDMSWLKKDKPFRMPKPPPGGPTPSTPPPPSQAPTTVQVKWSRKLTFTRDDIMEAFKKFGDVELVVLKEKEIGGRPSALVSFRDPASAQAAMTTKTENFKVRWPSKQPTPAPTPPQPSQYQTPQSPYSFTSPFGTTFPSPSASSAQSPFAFASPFGNPFAPSPPSHRTAAELDDFETQTLMRLMRAAQAQRETTPTPSPMPTPTPTPEKHGTHNGTTPNNPVDVDSPPSTQPIDVDAPSPSPSRPTPFHPPSTPIDVDAPSSTPAKTAASPFAPFSSPVPGPSPQASSPFSAFSSPPPGNPTDYESVTQMKLRRAAERQRVLEQLEQNEKAM